MTCDELRDSAAELVLGTLDGADRATALGHLTGCAECAAYVAGLGRTVDVLLLAGPEDEPSSGFESRVLTRLRDRRSGRRRVLAAAAGLALLAAGFAAGARWVSPADVAAAGPMRDRAGAVVGSAVVHRDRPAFVFVTVDRWGASGDYEVEAVLHDGTHVDIAPIRLTDGRGAAGGRLPVAVGRIRSIWVTDPDHEEWCAFRL